MANGRESRKRGIAVGRGTWLPLPLDFLRSRACAELSPHAAKLLMDVLSMLGPNATRNGDISLAPKVMTVRGWSGRSTLNAAVKELEDCGLLVRTRQGGRLDCTLYALTLYPIDCDVRKLDAGAVGSYSTRDFEVAGLAAPTDRAPAKWRRARKTQSVTPPRDKAAAPRTATVRTPRDTTPEVASLSRGGTKSMDSTVHSVPPRVTYLDMPSMGARQVA